MTEDQEALLPALKSGVRIEPPYSHAHVSEKAIHREILRIYHYAGPDTRRVYDLGHDTDRVDEENWVIRWMLWHVFRYRDNRNKSRRPSSGVGLHSSNIRSVPVMAKLAAHATVTVVPMPSTTSTASRYWDPVRNG